jgi:hypothetical protein
MLTSCVCIDSVKKKTVVLLCQGACSVQSCARVEYTCLAHVSSDTCVCLIEFSFFFYFRWWSRSFVSEMVFGMKSYSSVWKLSCIRIPAVAARFVTLLSDNWLHWAVFLLPRNVSYPVKEFAAFYGIRWFAAVFTRARHFTPVMT